jgi:uncharacterized RDD family membrane protein YckC
VHQRCPRCAATNPASAQLCGQCWVQLGPAPATAAPGQPASVPPGWAPGPPPAPAPAWPAPGPPLVVGDLPAQQLGGIWPRVGAYLVDGVIAYVVTILAFATLGLVSALLLPEYPAALDTDQFALATFLVLAVAYNTLMVAGTGQTLGMRLLGLRVVHLDESPPQLGAAFKRALVLTLLGMIPLALLLCALVMERDRRRQGWHDRAAGTFVISTRAARRW